MVGLKQFTGRLDVEDRISVCIPTARVGIVTIFSLRTAQRIIGKSDVASDGLIISKVK